MILVFLIFFVLVPVVFGCLVFGLLHVKEKDDDELRWVLMNKRNIDLDERMKSVNESVRKSQRFRKKIIFGYVFVIVIYYIFIIYILTRSLPQYPQNGALKSFSRIQDVN